MVVLFPCYAPFLACPVRFSTPTELICLPTKTLTELWEYFWSVSEIVTQWLTCKLLGFGLAKPKAAAVSFPALPVFMLL